MKQQPGKRKPALWGILWLAASAFVQAADTQAPSPTLVYSWPVNAGPLDPRGYSPNQMYAQAMVSEPLVRYTHAGTVEPWQATSWKVSDDGKTYTFTLRDGVHFSDGTVFDAAAAKANLDAVLANRQPPTANRQPPTANRQPPTANRQRPAAWSWSAPSTT